MKLFDTITYEIKCSIHHVLQLVQLFYRLLILQAQVILVRHMVIKAATQAAKGCQIPQVMLHWQS